MIKESGQGAKQKGKKLDENEVDLKENLLEKEDNDPEIDTDEEDSQYWLPVKEFMKIIVPNRLKI